LKKDAIVTGLDLPFAYYIFFAFIFGLMIGSFLNVVIHRLPLAESIVFPGSHCPACGSPIRPLDNIPLISYAQLRGRCRSCDARISPVYPLVEILTALLFVTIIYSTGPTREALLDMAFACIMLALVMIDARYLLLPNAITYPGFIFAIAAATLRGGWGISAGGDFDLFITIPGFDPWRAAFFGGLLLALAAVGFRLLDRLDLILFNKYLEWAEMNEESPGDRDMEDQRRKTGATLIIGLLIAAIWAVTVIKFSPSELIEFEEAYNALLRASVGAFLGGGLIWGLRAVYFYVRGIEGMGLGDVKMMSISGAFLGWRGVIGVMLISSILGVVAGIILALRSRQGLETPLPYGVCLGIASVIVMLIF
jgi:prepilin signal peptidase PulO-like enzyme (type II secretory pathway)